MTAADATSVIVDLLQRGHAVQFRARGDSMHPFIREDDVLQVEPGREARVGDVVLVLFERGLTAHRVIRRDDRIVTRGDNAAEADGPVSHVLGVVTAVERNGKHVRARRSVVWVGVVRWVRGLLRQP
ncbi:MAG TPA: S24 family peptidase [Thermoanaerobaculia bacterium]|nr:S24 family peptidase [Thermoanaerobaculia bacterium]